MDRVVGRRGQFYDQDDEGADKAPSPIRWGGFYDQDASIEQPRLDAQTLARIEREVAERRGEGRPAGGWASVPPASVEPPRPAPVEPQLIRIPSTRPADPRPLAAPPVPDRRPAPRYEPPPPRQAPGAGRRTGRQSVQTTPAPGPAPLSGAAGDSAQSLGRATAILAFGTFASRVTGFLRVLAIGYVLGVGSLSDAFNYANGIPNIVYDLLVGGILSATLIPVFVEHLAQRDRRQASEAVSAVMTAIAASLVVVSGVLWVIAPWIIRFYLVLNQASTNGAERALATSLLRDFAPQVFFLGTIVATTALLNARRRFTVAAVSPVLNNLVAIAALLVTKFVAESILTAPHSTASRTLTAFNHDSRAVLILGFGTTAGYALQLLVQLPATHRLGLRLRPVWNLRHPAVRRVAGLSSWLVGVVIANQVSLALVMVLAGQTTGGLTAYQFSYQFFQLPYALVAVSVASAIMPDLSERWANRDRVAFERQFVTGLRVTLAVLIPIAFVYMAVAQPFIRLAIEHGRVTPSGAHLVTSSLVLFAVGLPGFSAFFLLMRAYQAMQDARTMFWIYVLENAMTLVTAPILSAVLGVPGLALAWVAPYTVASIYAVSRLRRRVGPLGGWLTIRALMRILAASGVTVAVVVVIGIPLSSQRGDAILIGRLAVQVVAGAAVYVWLARVLRIRELRPVLAMASRVTGRRA